MPPDAAATTGSRGQRHLRLVRRRLRVADVALFYGERSGGIRTYLDAKARYADRTLSFEHHLIVPGATSVTMLRPGGATHRVRSVSFNRANGYRLPLDGNLVAEILRTVRPDVVQLHDPYWHPRRLCRLVQRGGGAVVMVQHSSAALDAHAWPGPACLYVRGLRAWLRRAYGRADAVMSACDPWPDTGRRAGIQLCFGLHPAFAPQPDIERGDHVLYAGRIAREKGIFALLDATAISPTPWPLRVIGSGPAEAAVRLRARRLGVAERLEIRPFISAREALACEYASASCVVMPGRFETFGLAALEASACAAPVVACEAAPSARSIGSGAITFTPGDTTSLLAAVQTARATPPDHARARALAERHSWDAALSAELEAREEVASR